MTPARSETRDERLHLRLSPSDDGLIRAAADAEHVSITEFVLRAARSSAADALADREHVVLDTSAWKRLEARLTKPGRRNKKAAELLSRPTPFTR